MAESKDVKKDARMPAAPGRSPSPTDADIQAEMKSDPRLISNLRTENPIQPPVPIQVDPPRAKTPELQRAKSPPIRAENPTLPKPSAVKPPPLQKSISPSPPNPEQKKELRGRSRSANEPLIVEVAKSKIAKAEAKAEAKVPEVPVSQP